MMSKSKWLAAAALLVTSTGAMADGTYQFDSITSLTDSSSIVGVLVNDTAPTTLTLSANGANYCIAWLELMMKQPGMFTLTTTVVTSATPSGTNTRITTCTLTAKP